MKKNVISIIIFIICIGIIIWDIFPKSFTNIPLFITYFFVMAIPVAYVGIFIAHIVIIRGYARLKKIFYDVVLTAIHKVIDDDPNFVKEVAGAYLFSLSMNFFILYFISITPISDVVTRIPGFDVISLKNMSSPIFDFQKLSNLGMDIVMFPFMALGVITLFILKFIRRRKHNQAKGNYPGARAVLGFGYAMIVAIYLNVIITAQTFNSSNIANSPLHQNITQDLMMTFFGIFLPLVMVIADRFLIKDLLNKS